MADEGTEPATRAGVRARQLAMAQCMDHEVVAKLRQDCGMTFAEADEWVDKNETELERWRHEGQAELRLAIHAAATSRDAAKELNGYQHATMLKLAEQHLCWSRESVTDKVQKAVAKALREAAKGSGKPGLKVAG